ncbi:MerR family transcriptional regulator [Suttonella sp. R2A3]|uniref:chaperone modulator CbpM n=1 Tax=Suttonella sp. R2A3 TaxID=2908648 RepID=UPI001F2DF608|nr:chaperone modulator CbpM [Suttonella sp. R2A3]UJF24330.1 MerR family transcriptional regulator [Suttonella sp. R2A3]
MNQDIYLNFSEILNATDCEAEWVLSLIEESVIIVDGEPQNATYSGAQLTLLRRAQRIRRDFDASAPATALILELLDELEALRRKNQ